VERRIFGLENEYGVTCTLRGQRRLSPDEVARYLFRRVVSWGRSSNVFLANAYAQMLGDVFTHEIKPMEVEILVAEVGADPSGDRLFHILYDGTVIHEQGFTVLGGEAEVIVDRLKETYEHAQPLDVALRAAVAALAGPDRRLAAPDLEVAVLARGNGRRAFRRLTDDEVSVVLGGGEAVIEAASEVVEPADETATGLHEGGPAEASGEGETGGDGEAGGESGSEGGAGSGDDSGSEGDGEG